MVFSIECENHSYFFRIVNLFNQISNNILDESLKIFDQDLEINCSNKVKILFDYFNIDFSDKKYTTKLIDLVRSKFDEIETQKILSEFKKISKLLEKNIGEVDLPITTQNDFDIESVLKFMKLTIQASTSLLDNLFLLIDVESIFHLNYFLIFVNLKSYLTTNELNELYKYALYHEIPILLIDNCNYGITLDNEKKLIIDDNLNEFMIQ